MRYHHLERASPKTFVLAGALMGITMVMFGLLLLELPTFPLFMLAIALAGLAAATGLLGLQRRLRARTPGLARVGAGASVLAASAALVLVAVIPVAFVVVEGLGREVGFVDPLFLISMVTMLAGLLLGLLVVGAAALRSDLAAPAIGGLLIAGGLLFLIPLANFVLDVAAPEAIALATFGIGAAIFIKVGRLLRAEAPTPAHGPATRHRVTG